MDSNATIEKTPQHKPRGTPLDFQGRTKYVMDSAGTIHRISPQRPWRGKSERRRVIAERHAK